jgi:hypothetical protein
MYDAQKYLATKAAGKASIHLALLSGLIFGQWQ